MTETRVIQRRVSYPPRICAWNGCGKLIRKPTSRVHKFCTPEHAQKAAQRARDERVRKALKMAAKNGGL